MVRQFIAKLLGSAVFLTITTFVSMFFVRASGLWDENVFLKFALAGIFGFVVNYVFLSYLVPKFNKSWQEMVSKKFVVNLCLIVTFIFSALGALTYLLMIRNDSFDEGRIYDVVSIYFIVSAYFVASAIGVGKYRRQHGKVQ